MVLEATMLCLDNSEWMRDGDYTPTRMEAQRDSVNLLCGAKTQSHPENTIGFLSMAGNGTEVHVTLTSDVGKILTAVHNVDIGGETDIIAGIRVAQLALKHRQNKNQRQRIILFVGSPIKAKDSQLVALGKRLKRNNVSVDVVNFGESELNNEKLESFLNAVNNNNTSHLVTITPGKFLSDALMTSPIVMGENEASSSATQEEFEFGVDPNLDPELALALRISMEEEQARAREAAQQGGKDESSESKGEGKAEPPAAVTVAGEGEAMDIDADDADAIAQAIAMSLQSDPAPASSSSAAELSEEEQMALAIQMSIASAKEEQGSSSKDEAASQSSSQPSSEAKAEEAKAGKAEEKVEEKADDKSTDANLGDMLNNPDMLSFIQNLPGVDANSDLIQNVIKGISEENKDEKEDKKE